MEAGRWVPGAPDGLRHALPAGGPQLPRLLHAAMQQLPQLPHLQQRAPEPTLRSKLLMASRA